MVMDVLAPIGQGIQYGAVVTNSKRLEDSVRAGGNGFMTMLSQFSQVSFTLIQADRALEASNTGATPFAARIILLITPSLLTWILYMGVENDTARDIVVFLQDQIGNLCQVAGVVSSVALIFFEQALLGGVSLGFLGVGFLDRNGLLPECMRHIIHDYTPTTGMVAGVVFGGIVEKIYAVANLAIFCWLKYQAYESSQQLAKLEALKTPEMRAQAADHLNAVSQKDARLIRVEQAFTIEQEPAALQGPLTAAKLQSLMTPNFNNSALQNVDVDADHIYYMTRPSAPNVDFRELKTMFDKIDWAYKATPESSCAFDVLRRKCAQDERFKKRQGDPLKKTEEAAAAISVIRKACAESAGFRLRHKDPLIKHKEGKTYVLSDEKLIEYAMLWANDAQLKEQLTDPLKKVEHGNIYVMTDEYLKTYAKDAMHACIDQIYGRYIPDGEPRSYDELHDNLKVITQALQLKATEGEVSIKDNERIDTLLTLAVEGGRYCGPGKYEVIERLYAGLVCDGGNCPTRKKVLNILQDKRSEQVMAMYAMIPHAFQNEIPQQISEGLKNPNLDWSEWGILQYVRVSAFIYNLTIDWHDKHVYNQFLNMFATDLGTRKGGADNDATAVIDPTLQLLCSLVAPIFKEEFMRSYSDSDILKAVTEKIATSGLTSMEVVQWWQTWIERQQDLTAEQKAQLTDNLAKDESEAELFGTRFYNANGSIAEPFVVAMLYDMGVFGDAPANP